LRDTLGRSKILVRIQRLEAGNPGDVRPAGDGLSEMRLDFGPGYRVYYKQLGSDIVLLFGGDKNSQDGDIRKAKKLASELEDWAMAKNTTAFDAAEYLNSPEDIAAYLSEAFETRDAAFVAQALGTVARAKGMTDIAKAAGLSRENLYKALGPNTHPEFETVMRVLNAIGVRLTAVATTPRQAA
jgi:probable addiction module antidote protein/putative addiction module killer protein